jgi:hypothetical protein
MSKPKIPSPSLIRVVLPLASRREGNIHVLRVPDCMVHDSPEVPYPWADGPEREEILDTFVARPRKMPT